MYELEIKTKDKLKRFKNPRKARLSNIILGYTLQIMTDDGKWHTVCYCSVGAETGRFIVETINEAIKNRKPSVYLDI